MHVCDRVVNKQTKRIFFTQSVSILKVRSVMGVVVWLNCYLKAI